MRYWYFHAINKSHELSELMNIHAIVLVFVQLLQIGLTFCVTIVATRSKALQNQCLSHDQ